MSLGAVPFEGGARFRVWAPDARVVEVRVVPSVDSRTEPHTESARRHPLAPVGDGMFERAISSVSSGDRYVYFVDGAGPFPDPASRFQPEGVHGPSEVVDPARFPWSDAEWRGLSLADLVLYELHVGTFTPEGTFSGTAERLPALRDLGVSAIELMPLGDFPGDRNWGYDSAAIFAPARCYGTPDELRALVDRAHRLGLGVVLDVVYNHFGPAGAYAPRFSRHFLARGHRTPWGAGIDLDGPRSRGVRDFLIENARMWIGEYHLDGLRLDATHALTDVSGRHFLAELSAHVRDTARVSPPLLIAEDDRNLAALLRSEAEGGIGLDAVWADDFYHQIRRLLTGEDDGYCGDFTGTVQDLATTMRQGWFFTGHHSRHRNGPRGSDSRGIPSHRFVISLQNHDQVGNRALGDRLTDAISLAVFRAASALLLCAPETPLLFMGQEWAARSPFRYFTDHESELGRAVAAGRQRDLNAGGALRERADTPDPQALATFLSSRLDWDERAREPHASTLRLYEALLTWRRHEPALRSTDAGGFRALALDEGTIALRREAGGAMLLALVRLSGAGSCTVPPALTARARASESLSSWSVLATTEEPRFAIDPAPPRIEIGPPLRVEFARPSAVLLTCD